MEVGWEKSRRIVVSADRRLTGKKVSENMDAVMFVKEWKRMCRFWRNTKEDKTEYCGGEYL